MADELRIALDMADTGLTLLGKVYSASAQIGTDVSMSEIGSSAFYVGSISLTGVADGPYMVRYDTASATYGTGWIYVLSEAVVSPEQYALATSIAALNDLSAAAVNAEVDTALADYDAPTKAELDTAKVNIIAEINDNENKIDNLDTTLGDVVTKSYFRQVSGFDES